MDKSKTVWLQKLKELINNKHTSAELIISGSLVDDKRSRRLIAKVKHAKIIQSKNNESLNDSLLYNVTPDYLIRRSTLILEPIALIRGISIQEYSKELIHAELAWTKNLDTFYCLIEAFEEYFIKILNILPNSEYKEQLLGELYQLGQELGTGSKSTKSDDILAMTYLQVHTIIKRGDDLKIKNRLDKEMP